MPNRAMFFDAENVGKLENIWKHGLRYLNVFEFVASSEGDVFRDGQTGKHR